MSWRQQHPRGKSSIIEGRHLKQIDTSQTTGNVHQGKSNLEKLTSYLSTWQSTSRKAHLTQFKTYLGPSCHLSTYKGHARGLAIFGCAPCSPLYLPCSGFSPCSIGSSLPILMIEQVSAPCTYYFPQFFRRHVHSGCTCCHLIDCTQYIGSTPSYL